MKMRTFGMTALAAALTLSAAVAAPGDIQPANPPVQGTAEQVPGFNVHTVLEQSNYLFLRGGAPTTKTMNWLIQEAKARGLKLKLVDLRVPAKKYDVTGEGGRLTPAQEKKAVTQAGGDYIPLSALDKKFEPILGAAMKEPALLYMHCQYGVNRTGYAIGRYAVLSGRDVDTEGLGDRDFRDGFNRQKKYGK